MGSGNKKVNSIKDNVIVFGSAGAIGTKIVDYFIKKKLNVFSCSREKKRINKKNQNYFSFNVNDNLTNLSGLENLNDHSVHSVVWAQGVNLNDNIRNFDLTEHKSVYDANVTYILLSLNILIQRKLLNPKAKLCIISSIWQNLAKQNKLTYSITKSALKGLVQSVAIDLGYEGLLINAVLPGAIDSPMTHCNLSKAQIDSIKSQTPLNSLASYDDIAGLVYFLCSPENTGITGQFICADRGFSNARII